MNPRVAPASRPWRSSSLAAFWPAVSILGGTTPGLAEPPPSREPATLSPSPRASGETFHALGVATSIGSSGSEGTLSYRFRLQGGLQLGIEGAVARKREAYISGWRVRDGLAFEGHALAMIPLVHRGPLDLDLRASAGLRRLRADRTDGPEDRSLALTTAVGPVANLRASERLTLRLGWQVITNVQTAPEGGIDALGQLALVGLAIPLHDALQLHVDFETGGLFGYDGDGGKFLARGSLGLRWIPGENARVWTSF